MGFMDILGSFCIQFIVGGASGFLLGKLAILILNKISLNNQSLYPILLLSFIFFIFTVTDLCKGNGYLAVYIAGIMVGNNRITNRKRDFNLYEWYDMVIPDYYVPDIGTFS